MKRIFKFLLGHKYLIIILVIGLFFRSYHLKELFMYNHDQDLAGWFIKDVFIDKHLRLIGQETSTHGIFIGPLFYYMLIPFYALFGMDPIGGTYLTIFLGLFTVWSFYFVFSKIFEKNVGLFAALIYAVSLYTVWNDREVVPTMPVILWSVWFLYGVNLLLNGKQKKAFILLGTLVGLIWHLNMALILLLPIILLALFISKKRIEFNGLLYGAGSFLLTSLPLILFEVRHGFSQTKALVFSLTTDQKDILTGFNKVKRVIYLASKDLSGLLWGTEFDIKFEYVFFGLILITVFLAINLKKYKNIFIILFGWLTLYLVFFSFYSKIVSEYYLNGLITFYIGVIALLLANLYKSKKLRILGVILTTFFIVINFQRLINFPINRSGYTQRKDIVQYIKNDSTQKGYPCVSISYITDPGYDLGYRYFIWLTNLKTKPVSEKVPVYSIVYPQKPVFKADRSFGSIDIINPEYGKYNSTSVTDACEGPDHNLEYPMFGFTN